MKKEKYFVISLFLLLIVNVLYADYSTKELYDIAKPAVVTIYTFDPSGEVQGLGSGFFINNRGHLITNYHVMRGATLAEVKTADGKKMKIDYVIAADEKHDLIKLKVNGFSANKKPHSFSAFEEELGGVRKNWLDLSHVIPGPGEDVVVIGSPIGLELTVSTGIVSAKRLHSSIFGGSEVRKDNEEESYVIQMDASISPGSSGGPVLTRDGKVAGIATFQFIKGQNLNFAIPAVEINKMKSLPTLLKLSEWSWGTDIVGSNLISNEEQAESITDRERSRGKDWVVPFDKQYHNIGIWDGKKLQKANYVKHQWNATNRSINVMRRSIIYPSKISLESGYYEHDGRIYTENEYAYIGPEVKEEAKKVESFESSGVVQKAINSRELIVKLNALKYPVLVKSGGEFFIADARAESRYASKRSSRYCYVRNNILNKGIFIWTGESQVMTEASGLSRKYDVYVPIGGNLTGFVKAIIYPETMTLEDYAWSVYRLGLEKDLSVGMIEPDENCHTCGGTGWCECPICKGGGRIEVTGRRFVEKEQRSRNAFVDNFSTSSKTSNSKSYACPAKCSNGRVGCPECILVGKAAYNEAAQEKYLKRFN